MSGAGQPSGMGEEDHVASTDSGDSFAATTGKRLLIAGGGTGGHLFPAMAVADAWKAATGGEVLFVGTPWGLESRLLPREGRRLATLRVGQLKGRGVWRRLRTLAGLLPSLWGARQILQEFRPHVVLGVGGYASAPAVVAAWLAGCPAVLHEQNAMPGLANRLLGRLVQTICLSFPQASALFPGRRVLFTGNPVRASLVEAASVGGGLSSGGPLRVLVFGGSQGAQILTEVVPSALAQLPQQEGVAQVQVWHQVRAEDAAAVESIYHRAGISAVCAPFFHDMAQAYQSADLIIARAGATTLAELTIMGRPALLIPYPYAADDHQTANARALVEAGGAWMQPQAQFTVAWLTEFLRQRLADREEMAGVGQRARSLAHPDAAQKIVATLLDLARTSFSCKGGE
ncbi:MAG: undecaprenyldiphospho-muramoylpentapeptide beta-N-acetylglucosaminyltransferase [Magnetococcales bacterium]|nr:undecaprenyldiphospho-muramoylpentapeptide beta-N-acetylglucosaminyltransferase [Magnetococcales bacterium]